MCGIGAGRNIGEMGQFYEMSEDFRKYIAEQEKQKILTKDQILNWRLRCPPIQVRTQTNSPAFLEVSKIYKNQLDNYFNW